MLVFRWQAEKAPEKKHILKMFEHENLQATEEFLKKGSSISDCRIPFSEVRMVVEGEMILNISGNELLLRKGDKVIIPPNTNFSKKTKASDCLCIYAYKLF